MKPKRVVFAVIVLLAAGVAVFGCLLKALDERTPVFDGKTATQWKSELASGDTARSNRAFAELSALIIPRLSEKILHDTNDSRLKQSVIESFNLLPGVHIYYQGALSRRCQAAQDLGQFGPAAQPATAMLLEVAGEKNGDPSVRAGAVEALGQIHTDPDEVIPLLMASLENSDLAVSSAAALCQFGSQARMAVPKLIPMLHARDKDVRRSAMLALYGIDAEAARRAGVSERQIKLLQMDDRAWKQLSTGIDERRKSRAPTPQ